jgi:hypothetical protein
MSFKKEEPHRNSLMETFSEIYLSDPVENSDISTIGSSTSPPNHLTPSLPQPKSFVSQACEI